MLYATAAIFYGAFTVTMGELGRMSFAVILSMAIGTISIIHYFTSIELVFRIFFGTMVFVVFLQCVWLLSTRVSDVAVVKDMKRLALYGAGRRTKRSTELSLTTDTSQSRMSWDLSYGTLTPSTVLNFSSLEIW